jgi:hypothetical protein
MKSFFVLVVAVFFAQPSFADESKEAPPVGWVTSVKGRASVVHLDKAESETIEEGAEIFLGDEIRTEKDSTVTIQLEDDSVVALAPQTTLKLSALAYSAEEKNSLKG